MKIAEGFSLRIYVHRGRGYQGGDGRKIKYIPLRYEVCVFNSKVWCQNINPSESICSMRPGGGVVAGISQQIPKACVHPWPEVIYTLPEMVYLCPRQPSVVIPVVEGSPGSRRSSISDAEEAEDRAGIWSRRRKELHLYYITIIHLVNFNHKCALKY